MTERQRPRKPYVEPDIRLGDLGTAKRRLCSFIAGTRYDPKVCGKIGDICRDMKDPCEAGRWYFISDRSTKSVRDEVGAFLMMHRHKLSAVLMQFPSRAKLKDMSEYPAPVQERLRSLGCEIGPGVKHAQVVLGALKREQEGSPPRGMPSRGKRFFEGVLATVVGLVVLAVIAIIGHLFVETTMSIVSMVRELFE